MQFPFAQYKTTIALAMTAAFSLSTFNVQAQTAVTAVSEQVVGDGLYEMVYLPETKALYVASAQGFKDVNGGALYRLDPATLKKTGETFTDYKNFGMTMDPGGKLFYTTNTLDGGVSKVDAESGKVLQRLMFEGKDKDGDPAGAREIFWHNGMLFIGGVADPGFISVVDANTMTLKHRIENAGKWVTGIIYSSVTQRIYAANGGGEILTINPETYKIEQRWTPGDGKTYLFLNMAEDAKTGRLFVTDDSKAKVTLVIDERTGKVLKRIEGDALGIKFNDKRNEIYISQRESKKVLQLDATTYAVKHSWSFDSHPNSLLISPDGQSLYVTVKQEFNEDNTTKGPDSVVRIALN